jgi:hypothetical protein
MNTTSCSSQREEAARTRRSYSEWRGARNEGEPAGYYDCDLIGLALFSIDVHCSCWFSQQTKALLNEKSLTEFLKDKLKYLGTSACPPYHLAIVIGGLSAEQTLKTVKLASVKYLDNLPTSGNSNGQAFRDLEWEKRVLQLSQEMGIGAQFGGKYFCHDVRVIRLPRHGASCPVGIGVSCSADRQAIGKINKDGVFLEQLETDVSQYLPEVSEKDVSTEVVKVDLNRPMKEILKQLSEYPIKTRLQLTGTLIVARDIAHAKVRYRETCKHAKHREKSLRVCWNRCSILLRCSASGLLYSFKSVWTVVWVSPST